MTFFAIAAILPILFWDAPADTAQALRDANIHHIAVPQAQADAWKSVAGITAETADLQSAHKLITPGVNNRANQASPTTNPWIDSNGWIFHRAPNARYYYEVPGNRSAIAAAEAYMYRVPALIHTDNAGLKPLGEMLAFLESLGESNLPPAADIGVIDDGSDPAGEFLNMLNRGNLMFRTVTRPDSSLPLNIKFGSKDYPAGEDPYMLAGKARSALTDDKRLVRVYGSPAVLAQLYMGNGRARLFLLNYRGQRAVQGLRVRVLRRFANWKVTAFGKPDAKLMDPLTERNLTELTISEMGAYAVVDLW